MKMDLDQKVVQWRETTRRFVDEELIPAEIEAEMNQGKLPAELNQRHKKMAIELGFSRMDVAASYGGLALRNVEQVAVWEQLGRVTNALCWCFSELYQIFLQQGRFATVNELFVSASIFNKRQI